MKSYNHLYELYLTEENCDRAITLATKDKQSKTQKKLANKLRKNRAEELPKIMEYASNFKNAQHTPRIIYDGVQRKQRTIIVPTTYEQVVHHMIINVLKPIFMKPMYKHSYGSIPGGGQLKGKKVISKWIENDKKHIKYCAKLDIHHYFQSIPHDILKEKLAKLIHDKKFLDLLYEVIDVQETGIPLGFYTSQWFANFYLTDLDHYITEVLKVPHYIRYMDDMILFGGNKRELHRAVKKIRLYLSKMLGLELKKNYQVFRFDYIDKKTNTRKGRDLDFLGYRFFRDRVILRKSIMLKACRKAKRMSKRKKTVHDARQIMSYMGWISHSNTYDMYKKRIKSYVCVRAMKQKISNYEKARRKQSCANGQAA